MRSLGLLVMVLAASLAAFAGAEKPVSAEVTAVHQLPANLSGAKFSFVPTAEQGASQEYLKYQDQVRHQLIARGIAEAPLADADLAVGLAWVASKGQPQTEAVPSMGAEASFGANNRGNADAATGAPNLNSSLTPLYSSTTTLSQTVYTRRLTLMMYAIKSATADQAREVYEGTVTSVGSSNELGPLVPKLIDALFADFPGKSGQVRTVQLLCSDCAP